MTGAAAALAPSARALASLAERWTLLESPAADAATNMAIDVALLRHAQDTGRATLRLYTWSQPTLSLGRHERARDRFDPARLAAAGVDIVRRPTGGRALLHGPELTYSVAAPTGDAPLRWRYDCINALLSDALGRLGVRATLFHSARTARPGGSVCFSEPSSGELTVDGSKLVASAQLEEPGAFLQHGSLLLRDAQPMIAALLATPSGGTPTDGSETATRATSLDALLGRPVSVDEVGAALSDALRHALHGQRVTSTHTLESLVVERSLAPHIERFSDSAWTWSR